MLLSGIQLRSLLFLCNILRNMNSFEHCLKVWGRVGHGGALVDSTSFVRRVAGSNAALATTIGKSFTRNCLWRFGVKLRLGIRVVLGTLLSCR